MLASRCVDTAKPELGYRQARYVTSGVVERSYSVPRSQNMSASDHASMADWGIFSFGSNKVEAWSMRTYDGAHPF